MKAQLSLKDFENISAYLDGQLSAAEMRRLEAQLKSDPERQAALDEMASTRMLLRSAPRYRAPRNFTLTPEMARQNTRRSLFSALTTFRFSAAMAAISMIAVFALELSGFLTTGRLSNAAQAPLAAPAMAAAPTLAAAEKSPQDLNNQAQTQSTLVFEWQAPQAGFGAGPGSGGGSSPDQPLSSAKPAIGMGGGPGESTSPLTGPVSLPPSAVQSLPDNSTQSTPPDAARSLAANLQPGNPILGLPSQADGGKMISPNGELQNIPEAPVIQNPESAAAQTIAPSNPSWLNPRRYVELGLVILAVLAIVSAVYFRRKAT